MDAHRQHWSQRQQQFRQRLFAKQHDEAMRLFLLQHAMIHSTAMSGSSEWSFEDELFDGFTKAHLRAQPAGGMNSIAWLIWHIARIEDVTMNLLVAGRPQVLSDAGWLARLHITRRDVGTSMGDAEVRSISASIDIPTLRAYRLSVGRRTREIVLTLPPEAWWQRVAPASIRHLFADDALAAGAYELATAWGNWKKAGMLTMPASRHSFTHLNEAMRVRKKVGVR